MMRMFSFKDRRGGWAERRDEAPTERLARALADCDAVVIGAGSGLSSSAGFIYTGERFERYFADFARKYHFGDMYAGGFYPYGTPEEFWAYWSRYIYINRYMDAPKGVYDRLLALARDKDYFVITTNVDHCFQKAGFDKQRLFYTQGDYGLWQCSVPCHQATYENEDTIRRMVEAQGFAIAAGGELYLPEGVVPKMAVPADLLPRCPVCGKPMTMNLRSDDSFVEDEGWHAAARRYTDFLRSRSGQRLLFWELGVGGNTPGIIKYPFWRMTEKDKNALYACLNLGQARAPDWLGERAICIDGDIDAVLEALPL